MFCHLNNIAAAEYILYLLFVLVTFFLRAHGTNISCFYVQ